MNTKTILAFGEVLWDLLPNGRELGGAPLNFIFRVNGLGDKGVMISRLGEDEIGNEALAKITSAGINGDCIQTDPLHPTGTVNVELDAAGKPDFEIIQDVAYDYIEPAPAILQASAAADCICFGTLIQRTAGSRQTLRDMLSSAGPAVKLLDINLRKNCYTPEVITSSMNMADILKLNDEEAIELAEMFELQTREIPEIARALIDKFNLTACVVTLGSQGAQAVTANETAYAPGFAVEVADTVGSGDSFTAGFLHKFLQGSCLKDCCEYGNAVGALVAGQPGGTCPLTPAEIENFIAAKPKRLTCQDFL